MSTSSHLSISKDGGVVLDLKHDRLLKLNAIGAEMWDLLSSGASEDQVVDEIAQRYGVDRDRVANDLRALLRQGALLGVSPQSVAIPGKGELPSVKETIPPAPIAITSPRFVDVVKAFVGLIAFDSILLCRSLKSLCSVVQRWPVRQLSRGNESMILSETLGAVERASVWYPKKALCLQRSAVTTCLLRHRGIQASMVVGVRPMPLLAHAWVEVHGRVVNDSPRVKSFYQSVTSY